jgi:hypothetical protein
MLCEASGDRCSRTTTARSFWRGGACRWAHRLACDAALAQRPSTRRPEDWAGTPRGLGVYGSSGATARILVGTSC